MILLLVVIFLPFPPCVGSRTYEENLWNENGQCNNKSNMMISWSNEIEIRLTPPVDTSEYDPVCTMTAEFNDTTASGLHISISGRTVCTTEVLIVASCRCRLICYRKEIKCGSTLGDEYWEDAYRIQVTAMSRSTGLGDDSKPLTLSVATVYNMNGDTKKGLGKDLIYVIIGVVIAAALVFVGVPLCMCFCCKYSKRSTDIRQAQGANDFRNDTPVNTGKYNHDIYKQYSHE